MFNNFAIQICFIIQQRNFVLVGTFNVQVATYIEARVIAYSHYLHKILSLNKSHLSRARVSSLFVQSLLKWEKPETLKWLEAENEKIS